VAAIAGRKMEPCLIVDDRSMRMNPNVSG
jgi:hypothetical protein